MRALSFAIDIHYLGWERVKHTHEKSDLEELMVRKAKSKKKLKAPRKAAAAFNEGALTKGELRKLNARLF
jgi:hypothetical protein